MTDLIVVLVVIFIVGAAIAYIIKAKRAGVKCIGCPFEQSCSSQTKSECNGGCESCSGCHTDAE